MGLRISIKKIIVGRREPGRGSLRGLTNQRPHRREMDNVVLLLLQVVGLVLTKQQQVVLIV